MSKEKVSLTGKKLKLFGLKDLDSIPQIQNLPKEERFGIKVVAHVLPFRTNNYVIDELIDWDDIPDDPIYQLTFLQKGMLLPKHFNKMADAVKSNQNKERIKKIASSIRSEMNPHPSGQMIANVPIFDKKIVPGVQHKYRETALVFPSSGQTCHAYCTFCFRWAQFIGDHDLKFATDESKRFQEYLKKHTEVTDVLFTGGDPMIMSFEKLNTYIEPLLSPEFKHINSIRIGTKSLSYWPYRFVSDKDSSDILKLFEKVMNAEKHLALMAHYNHWKELDTKIHKLAIRKLRKAGVKIRTQSPVIKHINDDYKVWSKMWKKQVNLGLSPYYMFVERDTGAKHYFEIPLAKAFEIYKNAYSTVSGLSRTVRGPVMSATPGKVIIEGISKINGEKVFVLNFLQGRNPAWVKKTFFAEYDKNATWLDQLKPAFGKKKFFFEEELEDLISEKQQSLQIVKKIN